MDINIMRKVNYVFGFRSAIKIMKWKSSPKKL